MYTEHANLYSQQSKMFNVIGYRLQMIMQRVIGGLWRKRSQFLCAPRNMTAISRKLFYWDIKMLRSTFSFSTLCTLCATLSQRSACHHGQWVSTPYVGPVCILHTFSCSNSGGGKLLVHSAVELWCPRKNQSHGAMLKWPHRWKPSLMAFQNGLDFG